jgi:hypothetical protein
MQYLPFRNYKAMMSNSDFHIYLKRKVMTILKSLDSEGDEMRKTLFNLESSVKGEAFKYLEELVVKVESLFRRARVCASAFKSNADIEAGLESYKKVFKMLWDTDMEITELRATLPNISGTRSGIEEVKVMADSPQANMISVSKPENKKLNGQILTSRPCMKRRRQHTPHMSISANKASPEPASCNSEPVVNKNSSNLNCVFIVIKSSTKECNHTRLQLAYNIFNLRYIFI